MKETDNSNYFISNFSIQKSYIRISFLVLPTMLKLALKLKPTNLPCLVMFNVPFK